MVLPPDAGPVQIKETRQAFFAGAAVLFEHIMRGLSEGPSGNRSDFDLLNTVKQELDRFGHQLDMAVLKKETH